MKIVLYMQSGSANHGCEAIVRSTVKIIKRAEDSQIAIWSFHKEEDRKWGLDLLVNRLVASEELKRGSISYYKALIARKIFHNKDAVYQSFIRHLFCGQVAISIGGDNYCYPWSAIQGADIDRDVRKWCRCSVLWGCSMEEAYLEDSVVEDLQKFDLITVRESLSYSILKGITDKAVLIPDPAFLLEKKLLPLPAGFFANNTVGLNLSPLIFSYCEQKEKILQNCFQLIDWILQNTTMSICLIPHVMREGNDDREVLQKLYETYYENNRISYIEEERNCEELKGYISRCRFFIGARTHATIAAYSSYIPTLVLGYSIKSRGIAKDIFGDQENYVIPVQSLTESNQLLEKFQLLLDKEEMIKMHLTGFMPQYCAQADRAGDYLLSLK